MENHIHFELFCMWFQFILQYSDRYITIEEAISTSRASVRVSIIIIIQNTSKQ